MHLRSAESFLDVHAPERRKRTGGIAIRRRSHRDFQGAARRSRGIGEDQLAAIRTATVVHIVKTQYPVCIAEIGEALNGVAGGNAAGARVTGESRDADACKIPCA